MNCELVKFLTENFSAHEIMIKGVLNTMKNQRRFNKNVVLFAAGLAVYIWLNEQDKNKMRKEINELKQGRGV